MQNSAIFSIYIYMWNKRIIFFQVKNHMLLLSFLFPDPKPIKIILEWKMKKKVEDNSKYFQRTEDIDI